MTLAARKEVTRKYSKGKIIEYYGFFRDLWFSKQRSNMLYEIPKIYKNVMNWPEFYNFQKNPQF